jgi:hypothetical protein
MTNQLCASAVRDDTKLATAVTLTKRGNGRWEWLPEAAQ